MLSELKAITPTPLEAVLVGTGHIQDDSQPEVPLKKNRLVMIRGWNRYYPHAVFLL